MNNRERFLATFEYKPVDHPPLMLAGGWTDYAHWHREGLKPGQSLYDYFEVEPYDLYGIEINSIMEPPFEEKILEETEKFVVKIDRHGAKVRNFKDGSSMPEFLEYPIKGKDDLAWLRRRFDPENPARATPGWAEAARKRRAEGAVVLAHGGMYFAFLNEQAGTENLLVWYYDQPELIHEVNELQCEACLAALGMAEKEKLSLECVGYHEDMAYKTASLISPAMFREFMTPYYRRIVEQASRMGVQHHYMDSDGNIEELIPLWLELGICIMSPMEIAAGMDPVRLRGKFGRDLRMIGGFDKRILASTPAAITKEMLRLTPLIEEGGFIVSCDHSVPPDVSLSNYGHWVGEVKRAYGIR